METTAEASPPSLRRQVITWLLISIPAGPLFGWLAAESGDFALVAWLVAGTWALGTAAAVFPELPQRSRNARLLLAGLFGAVCTAVAAAATYVALIVLIIAACDFGGSCLS